MIIAGVRGSGAVAWAEAYLRTMRHIDLTNRLATMDIGRKERPAVPFRGRGARSPIPIKHNVAWAEAYLHIKWHLDPSSRLATIDMGRKVGAAVPLSGAAESPSNTMWPGPRPTSMPSGILIHPSVWPQYTNVTDRTGQTEQTTSDSIGRTRFTNGCPKVFLFQPYYWLFVELFVLKWSVRPRVTAR